MLSLSFRATALAVEIAAAEDKIIGTAFKALAKAFIAVADISKLKEGNIDKINKMDEAKFKKRYAKVYEVIKDLPPELKTRFNITGLMTKEQVVKNIQSLDKKKLYPVIDSVPDTFIAGHFKRYLNEKKETTQKSNMVQQVNKFWNETLQKFHGITPSPKPQ